MNELHIRASVWYEENGLELEAFHHAAAANDVERAERLIKGEGLSMTFHDVAAPGLKWLKSLPATVLNARPSLWVMYAQALLVTGEMTGVEQKLQAAEAALQGIEPDDKTQDIVGQIAATRATLAVAQYQVDTIIAQSRRALKYLHPNNLSMRTVTNWTLGVAYLQRGDRDAAGRAFSEAISISQASGNTFINILASTGLGEVQESENQLYLAAQTYQHVLQLAGDPPWSYACEAHLGLARICYEWNDLDAAWQHGQQAVQLARQYDSTIDRFVSCEVFLARLKLVQGDVDGAAAMLAKAAQSVRQHNFVHRMSEVAAAQVLVLLRQGNLAAAAQLARTHELPLSQARVHLARGDTSAALAVLEPLRQQMEARGWQDERLKVMVLQAVALYAGAFQAHSGKNKAVHVLGDALALAEPGGFIRLFVDEGLPMAQLLSEASSYGIMSDNIGKMPAYTGKLLAVFAAEEQKSEDTSSLPPNPTDQPLLEPLSNREVEVLQLIAQGLSNREIGERLFLALDTIKGHNQKIFGKLQVKRRTEAVARARELGLL